MTRGADVTAGDGGEVRDFAPIQAVVDELAAGRMVLLVDDEDRENEGDLLVAAEFATPEAITFIITYGRGLVCVAITEERRRELQLEPMVQENAEAQGTAFTVSVDGTEEHGVGTGISSFERARTIELIVSGDASDLRSPGHMFPLVAKPGGVLERAGHTEAAVDLARLAGLTPAGVIVEVIGDDGHMLRRDGLEEFAARHGVLMSSIELLQEHLRYV